MSTHKSRRAGRHTPSCESLEGRVVLSDMGMGGGGLLGSLASLGVVTGGSEVGPGRGESAPPWVNQST